jgi:hypothetical protein
VAESAGVEPARPFGLVALAPRCLAARPTLRSPRVANPALSPPSYEGILLRAARFAGAGPAKQDGWGGRDRTCSLRSQNPPRRQLRHSPNARRDDARRVDHALIAQVILPLAAVEAAGAQAAFFETGVPSRMGIDRCARVSRSAPCRRARRGRRAAPAFPKHDPRLRLCEVSKGRQLVEVVASHGRLLWFEFA